MKIRHTKLTASASKSLLYVALLMLAVPATTHAQLLPDLYTAAINNTVAPQQAHPGRQVTVTYRGANNSSAMSFPVPSPETFGPAYGPWMDTIYLSDGTNMFQIGTGQFEGVLQPRSHYTRSVQCQIPHHVPDGEYCIVVHVDYDPVAQSGVVEEQNEANNIAGKRLWNALDLLTIRITGIQESTAGHIEIAWAALPHETYTILSTATLCAPFTTHMTNLSTQGTMASQVLDANTNRFFRIRCEP